MGEYEKNLRQCLQTAKQEFENRYGGKATIAVAAPGRVNLIGEHTDYNDGFVLPMALPMMTVVVGRESSSAECCVTTTAAVTGEAEHKFPVPQHPGSAEVVVEKPLQWVQYVKGVVALMNDKADVPGFQAVITSCVPLGGGVSSSASLEVATGMFVQQLLPARSFTPVELALLCQQAEHRYAGNKCGIMDQFISAMAEEGNALMIDCEQPLKQDCAQQVPMSGGNVAVLVMDTGVRHTLAGGNNEYNQRRESCERVAKLLGVKSLRFATMEMLEKVKDQLPDVDFKRARHVIGEITRTEQAVAALRAGEFQKFGELMNASHESLKTDYTVSCDELDRLVELARQDSRVYGSRMTGGGFGGCTVTLLHEDAVEDVIKLVKEEYPKAFPEKEAKFYRAVASAGAKLITNLL